MQLIVGLGNPGAQYGRTRHNAGFWLVDALADQCRVDFREERRYQAEIASANLAGHPVVLLKPLTFMNHSGRAVGAYAGYFRIPVDQILVVHDELDLAPGTVRLKRGGGHGGHNGLRDITAQLGADFARLRIGIGHPGSASEVVNYVLGNPPAEDRKAMDDAIQRALDVLPQVMQGHFDRAMNALNRRADSAPGQKAEK
ncbi:MAG: aminoacyl-tRNA hydrolase [Gammaproteobacteria bacterium]|nr:aminoacyl-tRNA hydrolase [Gammaproteobacteria bacterium]